MITKELKIKKQKIIESKYSVSWDTTGTRFYVFYNVYEIISFLWVPLYRKKLFSAGTITACVKFSNKYIEENYL